MEGETVCGEQWTTISEDELNAFLGLVPIAGVYRLGRSNRGATGLK